MDKRVDRVRVDLLKDALVKAYQDKLYTNRYICGFYVIAKLNGRKFTSIIYNNKIVAKIDGGKMYVEPFITQFWGDDRYKYDILCELSEAIGMDVVYKRRSNLQKKTANGSATTKAKTKTKKK